MPNIPYFSGIAKFVKLISSVKLRTISSVEIPNVELLAISAKLPQHTFSSARNNDSGYDAGNEPNFTSTIALSFRMDFHQ